MFTSINGYLGLIPSLYFGLLGACPTQIHFNYRLHQFKSIASIILACLGYHDFNFLKLSGAVLASYLLNCMVSDNYWLALANIKLICRGLFACHLSISFTSVSVYIVML